MTNGMTNVAAAALIISVLIPFLLSGAKQVGFPRWANLLVTVVICVGAALLTLYAAGQLHWTSWSSGNLLVTFGLIFAGSQAIYGAYVKDSPLHISIAQKTSFIK